MSQPTRVAVSEIERPGSLDSMEGIVRAEPSAPPRLLAFLPRGALLTPTPSGGRGAC